MMFHRRKISPEWQAITSAQAAQVDEARASQAAARQDFINALPHIPLREALDLMTAHYAQTDPDNLHPALIEAERTADRWASERHLETHVEALAREAWRDIEPR